MHKPLLIGQAPGPNTRPDLPLFPLPSTSAGGRLAAIMGLHHRDYLRGFDRMNLLRDFPGKHKRDDKFPMSKAKVAAQAVTPLLKGRTVLFIGRNVANAFELDFPFHQMITDVGFCRRFAIIPHTSGRSHWYNSAENREEAQSFWLQHMPSILDINLLLCEISKRTYGQAANAAHTGASNDHSHVSGHPLH